MKRDVRLIFAPLSTPSPCSIARSSALQVVSRACAGSVRSGTSRFTRIPLQSQRLDQAAVDHEVRARDVRRAIAGEKEHQIGDFVGARETARREAAL